MLDVQSAKKILVKNKDKEVQTFDKQENKSFAKPNPKRKGKEE